MAYIESAHKTNKRRNRTFIYVVIAVIALILIFIIIAKHHKAKTPQPGVAIAPSGIHYPAGWQELNRVSASDKNSGVVSEALLNNSSAAITIRVDNSPLTKYFNIQQASSQAIAKLSSSLSGFSLISKSITKVGNNQAIVLSYNETNSAMNYRQTQVIVPTANKTFYLTISALNSDFNNIASVNGIINAFGVYVDKHQ